MKVTILLAELHGSFLFLIQTGFKGLVLANNGKAPNTDKAEQESILAVASSVDRASSLWHNRWTLASAPTLCCCDPPASLPRGLFLYCSGSEAIAGQQLQRHSMCGMVGRRDSLWGIVSPVNGPVPTRIFFSSEAGLRSL